MTRSKVVLAVAAALATTACGPSPKETAHAAVDRAMELYAERGALWATAVEARESEGDPRINRECREEAILERFLEGKGWGQMTRRERELASVSSDIRHELRLARMGCTTPLNAAARAIRTLRSTAETAGEVPTTTFTRIRETINQTTDDTLERMIAEAEDETELFTVIAALTTGDSPQAWSNTVGREYQQERIDRLVETIEQQTARYVEELQEIEELKERYQAEVLDELAAQ
jgi:hypothetical protein